MLAQPMPLLVVIMARDLGLYLACLSCRDSPGFRKCYQLVSRTALRRRPWRGRVWQIGTRTYRTVARYTSRTVAHRRFRRAPKLSKHSRLVVEQLPCEPRFGSILANIGRCGPNVGRFGPCLTEQKAATLGQRPPNLTPIWSSSANVGRTLPNVRQHRPQIGQSRPFWSTRCSTHVPKKHYLRRSRRAAKLSEVAEQMSTSCRQFAHGTEIRPELDQHFPMLANVGLISANIDRCSAKLEQTWSMMPKFWPMLASVWQISDEFG